jgi:hypothetical protein
MLPAEWRKDHLADSREAFAPSVTHSTHAESFWMERGHGKFAVGPLSCCLGPFRGNDLVWHRSGILAAAARFRTGGEMGIDANQGEEYDPPRCHK